MRAEWIFFASGALLVVGSVFGIWRATMPIRFGAICKNCGKNIFLRNENQGWLHSDNESRCMPTYAEPVRDPTKGASSPYRG